VAFIHDHAYVRYSIPNIADPFIYMDTNWFQFEIASKNNILA